jgi:hypothetical protein
MKATRTCGVPCVALLGCLALAGCATGIGPRVALDAGPLACRDRTLDGGAARTRAAGPLLESQTAADGSAFTAVRPFYSHVTDTDRDRSLRDILWPIGMVKTLRGDCDWRFFPAFGHDFDVNDPDSRHRWWVLPLLFGGQDAQGDKYFAVFPLGGRLNEFLGRDHITFVLFPLYLASDVKGIRTVNWLWPIYSRTWGSGVERFRIFPFYGTSAKKGIWRKRFILWPFWTSVAYDYEDVDVGGGFVFFPFFGKIDVGERHSRMLFPPFIKWEWAPGHRAVNCPWPFFQYQKGDVDMLRFWPLWGQRTTDETSRKGFALWPLYTWGNVQRGASRVLTRRLAPLVYSEKQVALNQDGEPTVVQARHFKLWPLFGYRRDGDSMRFRAPELWPLRDVPAIERNMAPLWSLFLRTRQEGVRETELLWGLVRHRVDANGSRFSCFPFFSTARGAAGNSRAWSLLGGLIGYEREGLNKCVRLLYCFRFGARGASTGHNDGAEP